MIIINLLPPEIIEKRKRRQQATFFISIIILLSIILSSIWLYLNITKTRLIRDIKKIDEEIATLQPILDRIKQIEAENAEINRRLSVIQDLIKGRFKWVKILEEINKTITDEVWLSSISPAGENQLSLSCSGFSNYSAAEFIVALMENPLFSNIQIGAISGHPRKGEKGITSFNLTLNYNL